MTRALVWLRRDLRTSDHTALQVATCRYSQSAAVFVFDTDILESLPSRKDARVTFIHQSVNEVSQKLESVGSRLVTLHGNPTELIPKLARGMKVDAVVTAHDDDPYALIRDESVKNALQTDRVDFVSVKDHVVFERQEILNSQGAPFKVFTPYRNAWLQRLAIEDFAPRVPNLRNLMPRKELEGLGGAFSMKKLGFAEESPWIPGGESRAIQRLDRFLEIGSEYAKDRNFPSPVGTSTLSADLRHGTVSVRELVRQAQANNMAKWLDELIWREFFHMILANFPFVAKTPFRPEFRSVGWPGELTHLNYWKEGQTGYPLVDAAMRCLDDTGWMHNRLRMVTAMFLTKDLLLDYHLGEEWFAQKLLDFDLASNNGGWQWSASTGVDSQPWFRILNPLLQSQKFDPEGQFIRRWCPELAHLDNTRIHWPHVCGEVKGYPAPIVDHKLQRQRALAFLESVAGQKR